MELRIGLNLHLQHQEQRIIRNIIKYCITYKRWIVTPIIGVTIFLFNCDISEVTHDTTLDERLELIYVYDLDLPEPSGLTLNSDKTAFYVVSDPADNQVRKISLQGDVLRILNFVGNDLEGITYDTSNHTLWVTEEGLREIVQLDTMGNELNRLSISVTGFENQGLEGITFGSNGNFFILNETNPGLVLEIDSMGTKIAETSPETALDYSGICYVPELDKYFIVSDESQQLMIFNSDIEQEDILKFDIDKAEGVDYDEESKQLYIVSDRDEKLYVYKLNLDI
jgi:uncharacterized protein YjiK